MEEVRRDELEEFYDALEDLSVGVEPFRTEIGSRPAIVNTDPGLLRLDGRTVGYIDYRFAEKRDGEFGERGRAETYVPGVLRDGRFDPVLWKSERQEIKSELEDEEVADTVHFAPRSYYLPGDRTSPEIDPEHEYLNRILVEEGFDMDRYLEEGIEPSTGVVRITNSFYGYLEAEKYEPESGVETDIVVLGELRPGGEIRPVENERALYAIREKLDSDIDDIDRVYAEEI
ncbi:MAG: hypothetical protein ABEK01_05485 [Candidatus Nanohaloarchaea archaeon]